MNLHTLTGVFAASATTTAVAAATDFTGIAILIGTITTSVLAVLTFIRQGKMAKLAIETHDLVNGLSARKDAAIGQAAFAEGKEAGVEKERAAPMVSVTLTPPAP